MDALAYVQLLTPSHSNAHRFINNSFPVRAGQPAHRLVNNGRHACTSALFSRCAKKLIAQDADFVVLEFAINVSSFVVPPALGSPSNSVISAKSFHE